MQNCYHQKCCFSS